MSQGEVLIAFLLVIIAWFLYQIAKQLSYLTGKKVKLSFFNKQIYNGLKRKYSQPSTPKQEKEEPPTKLPN